MVNASQRWFARPENVTGFVDFFLTHQNDAYFGGILGYALLTVIFIIVFANTMNTGLERAFAAASFFVFLSAAIFTVLGILGNVGLGIAAVMLIVAIVINNGGGGRPI